MRAEVQSFQPPTLVKRGAVGGDFRPEDKAGESCFAITKPPHLQEANGVKQGREPLEDCSLLSLLVGVRGFELSATALSVFVVAFCVLKLSTRCLCLRAIFYLNLLALLHRCYM